MHSILSSLVSKHGAIDTLADMPIHHSLFIIGCSSHMTTCLLYNLTQILYQGLCRKLRLNLTVCIQFFHSFHFVYICHSLLSVI